MLCEIFCEQFHQKSITFHDGLNVVLGTSKADNSIGKSTLMLIVDFAFGANYKKVNREMKKTLLKQETDKSIAK